MEPICPAIRREYFTIISNVSFGDELDSRENAVCPRFHEFRIGRTHWFMVRERCNATITGGIYERSVSYNLVCIRSGELVVRVQIVSVIKRSRINIFARIINDRVSFSEYNTIIGGGSTHLCKQPFSSIRYTRVFNPEAFFTQQMAVAIRCPYCTSAITSRSVSGDFHRLTLDCIDVTPEHMVRIVYTVGKLVRHSFVLN